MARFVVHALLLRTWYLRTSYPHQLLRVLLFVSTDLSSGLNLVLLEMLSVVCMSSPAYAPPPLEAIAARSSDQPYTAILVVPTGVGAAIGGYAGDALPVARAFASVADRVVTHPNVLNGAQLYWPDPKMFYTEGFALDEFAAGRWGLRPVTSQRVGLLLDAGIEPDLILRHLQAADACRATLGVNVACYTVTDAPLGVALEMSPAGASWVHAASLTMRITSLQPERDSLAVASPGNCGQA